MQSRKKVDQINEYLGVGLGEYKASHDLLERALRILEDTHGKHNIAIASTVYNFAIAKYRVGDPLGAMRVMGRAKSIFAEAHGDSHPSARAATHAMQEWGAADSHS